MVNNLLTFISFITLPSRVINHWPSQPAASPLRHCLLPWLQAAVVCVYNVNNVYYLTPSRRH